MRINVILSVIFNFDAGVGSDHFPLRLGSSLGVSPRITTNSLMRWWKFAWGQSAHHHKFIDAVVEVVEKLAWHGR